MSRDPFRRAAPRFRSGAALAAALLPLTLAPPALPADAARIEAVTLTDSGSGVDLTIEADRPIEWRTTRDRDRNLVLELPDALPGPGVSDLGAASGLIRSVSVRATTPGAEARPATRVTVQPRSAAAHSVLADGNRLLVRFRPARAVPLPPGDRHRVTADPCLNVRHAGSIDARILGCVPSGVLVTALGSRGDWQELRMPDGQRGWAVAAYLEPVAAPEPAADESSRAGEDTARAAEALRQERDDLAERLAAAERRNAELARRLERAEGGRDLARDEAADPTRRPAAAESPPEAAVERAAEPAESLLVPSEPLGWSPQPTPDEAAAPLEPAEPLAGLPEPPPEPPPSEVIAATVRDWAAAWADQRVDDYIGYYASEFELARGQSRPQWEATRRARVAGPGFIEIEIHNLQVTVLAADRAIARFEQSYRSDSFADRVLKILRMVRTGTGWRIVEEVTE